jgi:hypothetical protein
MLRYRNSKHLSLSNSHFISLFGSVSKSKGERSSSYVSFNFSSYVSLSTCQMVTGIMNPSKYLARSSVILITYPPSASAPNFFSKLIILGLLSVISSRAPLSAPFPLAGGAFPLAFGSSTTASTGSSPSI